MRQLREGDILGIPVAEDGYVIGQIISFLRGDKRAMLMVIYPGVVGQVGDRAGWSEPLVHPPQLEAMTFDVALKSGRWVLLDNRPLPHGYTLPFFKAQTPAGYVVVDLHSNVVAGRARNVKKLRRHTILAPGGVERVARAASGIDPWQAAYEDFLIPGTSPPGRPRPRLRLPWRGSGV